MVLSGPCGCFQSAPCVHVHHCVTSRTSTARPGDVLTIYSAWEYSITREWVFALDFIYQHDASTRLNGATGDAQRVDNDFGSAWRFGVAPAIEYNWSRNVGVIVGTRWYVAGRNSNATVTPMAAINLLF